MVLNKKNPFRFGFENLFVTNISCSFICCSAILLISSPPHSLFLLLVDWSECPDYEWCYGYLHIPQLFLTLRQSPNVSRVFAFIYFYLLERWSLPTDTFIFFFVHFTTRSYFHWQFLICACTICLRQVLFLFVN